MKRRLFKPALFLLLGAITNVAVAWGSVSLSRLEEVGELQFPDANEFMQRINCSCNGRDRLIVRRIAWAGFGVRRAVVEGECVESGPCISYLLQD